MRNLIFILFCILGTLGFSQEYSKLSDPSSCKKAITAKTKSTQSIKASFSETVYSSMVKTPAKAKGKMQYKREGKIRWEHLSPKSQVVLINGKSIRLQENGKEITNAGSNRVVRKVQSLMVQLINGDFLNEKDFRISYYANSTNYKLYLKPKSSRMSKYISVIQLIFDKKTLALKKMVLSETEKDKVVYTFSDTQFNQGISDKTFTSF